jgi:hypothetical protein
MIGDLQVQVKDAAARRPARGRAKTSEKRLALRVARQGKPLAREHDTWG